MTCSARTWRIGEENNVEKLLTFQNEEDRCDYMKMRIGSGELVAPLTPQEKLKTLLNSNIRLLQVLVIKDPSSGEFEEIHHRQLIGLRRASDDGLI